MFYIHKQFGLKVFNICQIGYKHGDGAFSQDDTAAKLVFHSMKRRLCCGVRNQSCRSLTLVLCKQFLLFK